MPAGRPYEIDREELKAKMRAYLKEDCYKTITSFCRKNQISRSWLYVLYKEDKEIKDIGEQINLAREEALEEGGLNGDLNAGMAKFALNQLGWSEKQEVKQDHTSKGESLNATVKFVTNKPS